MNKSRGAHRLELSRALLQLLDDANVMQHINAMQPADREYLRGLVDWVEEYDNFEPTAGKHF